MATIIRLRETLSTNSYLKELILTQRDTLSEGMVVYADFQAKGRGQAGNFWESEDGENILASIYFSPNHIEPSRQFMLSQLISLALVNLLEEEISDVSIKWPNDIYWKEKKLAGILIENELMGNRIVHSVVGIGLNVNQIHFQSDAPNPVSLSMITGKQYDREPLLHRLIERLYTYYMRVLRDEIPNLDEEYQSHLFWKDGFHRFEQHDEIFSARIVNVQPNGQLVLQRQDGKLLKCAFKEVRFVL
ncbi:biotin--[acetyl-CoA-carboxylase] ligase [Microbacter margulisiae]|uniref:BirA family biotin operon repressor/biotin-[acetyl-CoA-carboxylase] ligase n=1 Tax=Microbacter margulisiae TaxID=1350067 RepID=A0A7W5DRC9_9PORP|nr:biotin--[acetyl-CoA-carboxylase] ligase [Microbacter margulisiae]MBB3186838.1 BirA family biotin operon repressor/biotin-[acetyl-CoA-carboxylase] ligase [Microbacter margulisiae]